MYDQQMFISLCCGVFFFNPPPLLLHSLELLSSSSPFLTPYTHEIASVFDEMILAELVGNARHNVLHSFDDRRLHIT
jgi:hypothetical protein